MVATQLVIDLSVLELLPPYPSLPHWVLYKVRSHWWCGVLLAMHPAFLSCSLIS